MYCLTASRRGQDNRCRHRSAAIPRYSTFTGTFGKMWQDVASYGKMWQHVRTLNKHGLKCRAAVSAICCAAKTQLCHGLDQTKRAARFSRPPSGRR